MIKRSNRDSYLIEIARVTRAQQCTHAHQRTTQIHSVSLPQCTSQISPESSSHGHIGAVLWGDRERQLRGQQGLRRGLGATPLGVARPGD